MPKKGACARISPRARRRAEAHREGELDLINHVDGGGILGLHTEEDARLTEKGQGKGGWRRWERTRRPTRRPNMTQRPLPISLTGVQPNTCESRESSWRRCSRKNCTSSFAFSRWYSSVTCP
jgi:hypothetical protein